jgi:hypothetical protein
MGKNYTDIFSEAAAVCERAGAALKNQSTGI